MFPELEFEFVGGVSVPSNVVDQPFTNAETFTGAKNRVDNASIEISGADFYVGIEGGVDYIENEMESFAWVVVKSANKYGKSRTGTLFLPDEVVKLIKEGKELGEAGDIVFKKNNSKQASGAVGILTGDVIDRTKFYTEAVILSLITFRNIELY